MLVWAKNSSIFCSKLPRSQKWRYQEFLLHQKMAKERSKNQKKNYFSKSISQYFSPNPPPFVFGSAKPIRRFAKGKVHVSKIPPPLFLEKMAKGGYFRVNCSDALNTLFESHLDVPEQDLTIYFVRKSFFIAVDTSKVWKTPFFNVFFTKFQKNRVAIFKGGLANFGNYSSCQSSGALRNYFYVKQSIKTYSKTSSWP